MSHNWIMFSARFFPDWMNTLFFLEIQVYKHHHVEKEAKNAVVRIVHGYIYAVYIYAFP